MAAAIITRNSFRTPSWTIEKRARQSTHGADQWYFFVAGVDDVSRLSWVLFCSMLSLHGEPHVIHNKLSQNAASAVTYFLLPYRSEDVLTFIRPSICF